MPRIPLTSGAYSAPSLIANAQRCVNLFPETNPQDTNPPVPVTHYPRPGLTPLGTSPLQGSGRCLFTSSTGNLYCVINQSIYYIDPNWTYTLLGQLLTPGTTPVIMADNGTTALVVDGDMSGNAITLPQAVAGRKINIVNSSGQTITIFPFLGDRIGANAVNGSVTSVTARLCTLVCGVRGTWWGGITAVL